MGELYNIRMRSAKNDDHISGAERITTFKNIQKHVAQMIDRSFNHTRGKANFVSLKIEKIEETIDTIAPISNIREIENNSTKKTLKTIINVLSPLRLDVKVIQSMYQIIINDKPISGAMIVDFYSGKRIDNKEKGIRVSRFDWNEETKRAFIKQYPDCHSDRKLEAIALASKVQQSQVIAEVCCSDDPHYTTGYIALNDTYIRIPNMKEMNSLNGGRIFLVDSRHVNVSELINYLERKPVLIGEKRH